ncbi:MAG TPA: tetratricopeptide repeat protein, partial [Bacteroidia bacterium]|nr:tetratricopeptide repeat protein [Bacteroidia bacterium]
GKNKIKPAEHGHGFSLEQQLAEARKRLKPEVLNKVTTLEKIITSERDFVRRGQHYDSLIRVASSNGEFVLAARKAEEKAVHNNGSGADWEHAGRRYYSAIAYQRERENVPVLYESAIRCYNKALDLEPDNAAAKIGLGISVVQSSSDPMQGVKLLLEVEKADSTNVDVQLALGDLAVESKQYDKAVLRYGTALRLRPDLYGIHLSLADVHNLLGDTATAIAHLEEYVKSETDPVTKNDIQNAISRLRTGK